MAALTSPDTVIPPSRTRARVTGPLSSKAVSSYFTTRDNCSIPAAARERTCAPSSTFKWLLGAQVLSRPAAHMDECSEAVEYDARPRCEDARGCRAREHACGTLE